MDKSFTSISMGIYGSISLGGVARKTTMSIGIMECRIRIYRWWISPFGCARLLFHLTRWNIHGYYMLLSESVGGIPINKERHGLTHGLEPCSFDDFPLTMLTLGTTCGWVCSTPPRSTVSGWTLGRFNSSWRCTNLCHLAELPRAQNQGISLRLMKRSAVKT